MMIRMSAAAMCLSSAAVRTLINQDSLIAEVHIIAYFDSKDRITVCHF